MKKTTTKASYKEIQLENKKLVKEISKLAIKNVELEVDLTKLKINYDKQMNVYKENDNLKKRNHILKDILTQYTRERAYLTTTLVEIVNCEEMELIKGIAGVAIGSIKTPAKLDDKVPF
jgi:predicted RNase H-like nuclease (RuvC/YqgF family)